MPTAVLSCPRCSRSLKTTRAFTAGSRFRCPKCGASFKARPEDVPAPDAPPGVRPLPPPLDEGPPRRGGARWSPGSVWAGSLPLDEGPPRRGGAWPLLFGLIGLGVLLLAGAGAVLAFHFLPTKGPRQAVVSPSPSSVPDAVRPTAPDNPPDIKDNTDLPKPTPARPDLPPGPARPDLGPDEPPSAALSVLPPEEQEKVNKAIERGVKWLKKKQDGEGTWGRDHPTGLAALPALTLLECGVPANDPNVEKAVAFVRRSVPRLTATYELALAILLLDRVGDPADEPTIRTLALRLLAGESPAGGWTYQCPVLSDKDERSLYTILETTRPRSSLDLVATRGGDEPADLFTGRADEAPAARPGGGVLPLAPPPDAKERKEAKAMYDGLSGPLKSMPALRPPMRKEKMPQWDRSDNSNTQFATLGLWAAGRHGVPMERALDLLARRFQVSQTPAGGWAYNYQRNPRGGETSAMTGAGLLGLAVGHGLTADLRGADRQTADEDPRVEKGMNLLAKFIGKAHGRGKGRSRPLERNYYFLWSVERVGMLYGRKTMGDKEWYPWGAEDLIEMQGENGDWRGGTYPMAQPVPDTCFALLFLKRANLAKDLTNKLQFLTQIKER